MSTATLTQTAKGGFWGHLLRRLTHIASIFIPLIYYQYHAFFLAKWISLHQLILTLLIIIMIVESLRLHFAWVMIGQREYENSHISGFIWSICSSFLVVLTVNSPGLAFAIIISYAIGDPLMGEMRKAGFRAHWVIFLAFIIIAGIWYGCLSYFELTVWWLLIILMPLITIAAEWPRLRWIDDNALMQLIPLIVIWIFFYV